MGNLLKVNSDAELIARFIASHIRVPVLRDGKQIGFRYI